MPAAPATTRSRTRTRRSTRWSPATGKPRLASSPRPRGEKPFRSVVDLTDPGVGIVEIDNGILYQARKGFVTRLGFEDLLEVKL